MGPEDPDFDDQQTADHGVEAPDPDDLHPANPDEFPDGDQ